MRNAKKLLKTQISAAELFEKLLALSVQQPVCLLDSSGVAHLGSHLLIAGIAPIETVEFSDENPAVTLELLDRKINAPGVFSIFTLSYDFGLKLEKITPRNKRFFHHEPDLFLAVFDCLIVHDYAKQETVIVGNNSKFAAIERLLVSTEPENKRQTVNLPRVKVISNLKKAEYLAKIEEIKELIRRGETYQTNLTQQLSAELPQELTAQQIFRNLRADHPAPFAAFIQRHDSTVVSASPERFFRVKRSGEDRLITTNPIKGTRPRGRTVEEDERLKKELLESEKDRAENVMIVDLLRNDLGRICEFGSVSVEKLCELEEHPTLFHLVSTVSGKLRSKTRFSEIIRAVFPCGSITGAPKIRTMQLIDELETANRGLSMGAIGFSGDRRSLVGCQKQEVLADDRPTIADRYLDLSVAIRTLTIRNQTAVFNVGGGIVIDSDPEDEYLETLTKAKALLGSMGGELEF